MSLGQPFQPRCHKWSAGVLCEFGRRSFISRAIGGYESPAGHTVCLVNYQTDLCALTIFLSCQCAMRQKGLKNLFKRTGKAPPTLRQAEQASKTEASSQMSVQPPTTITVDRTHEFSFASLNENILNYFIHCVLHYLG